MGNVFTIIRNKYNSLSNEYASSKDIAEEVDKIATQYIFCLLYTSPSPRDSALSRMPSSA